MANNMKKGCSYRSYEPELKYVVERIRNLNQNEIQIVFIYTIHKRTSFNSYFRKVLYFIESL